MGSTMALTDSNGDVVNAYEYDVFGEVRSSSGSLANFFEFAGEQVDSSTDLQYLRARYYDITGGRFISRDPLSGDNGDPRTDNRYSYAVNSPCNYVDPAGLAAEGHACFGSGEATGVRYSSGSTGESFTVWARVNVTVSSNLGRISVKVGDSLTSALQPVAALSFSDGTSYDAFGLGVNRAPPETGSREYFEANPRPTDVGLQLFEVSGRLPASVRVSIVHRLGAGGVGQHVQVGPFRPSLWGLFGVNPHNYFDVGLTCQ